MNLQPHLEDDLIHIRPLQYDDFEALFAVASDPLIWEQHTCYDRYKPEVFTKLFQESMESRGALIVLDKQSGEMIGSSRYASAPNDSNAVEIGWSFLARKYWGGKYNGAVKKLMIDHAFSHDHMHKILFHIAKVNIRSQKAVEKIGGHRIKGPEYKNLFKNPAENFTYMIKRLDWIDAISS